MSIFWSLIEGLNEILINSLSCESIHDKLDENTKELKGNLKRAKQNLLSFLLRVGISYSESGNYWTDKQ